MNDKLTPKQLNQLIAEVERLSQARENDLDREQVKQILAELNLPTDNIDEALMQIRRREALASEQQQKRLLILGFGLALLSLIGWGSWQFFQHRQAIARVSADPASSRLTLERYDSVNNLSFVDRQKSPTIYYQVKLQQTPIGRRLQLGCNWTTPEGQLAHQNRYQTRTIEKNAWSTRCRHQFGTTSSLGTWQVEMFLGDRILSQTEFTVK
ncbi:MAG: hypothetical protein J7647_29270 [Cyanobacteria bacterium SBLK]|nr:hypothetical protein [Cyanobacteria bacterium SBLK]